MTTRQSQSIYERVFYNADHKWYTDCRVIGREKANQLHQERIHKAYDAHLKRIANIQMAVRG